MRPNRFLPLLVFGLTTQICLAQSESLKAQNEGSKDVEQAETLMEYHRPHDAIELLNRAIELNPDNINAHLQRANALVSLDEVKPALIDLDIVIKHGKNGWAHELRAKALYALGKPEEALSEASLAVEQSVQAKNRKNRLYLRANLYRYLKKPEKALPDLEAALALEQKPTKNFYYNRANAYFDMGQYQKAVDDFTSALAIMKLSDNERGHYYGLRAAAYKKLGKRDLADADNQKANAAAKSQLGD